MKIVTLPGVGFHDNHSGYDDFAKSIGHDLECISEVYYWRHEWPLPEIKLPYIKIRKWSYEVILDFQQVILHAFDTPIPEADYYIGHSAGSILALAQKNIPCIIFGSPACLIESIQISSNIRDTNHGRLMDCIKSKNNILNIINKYDQIAYYFDSNNVENWVFEGPWYNPNTYDPIQCHTGYWKNESVKRKIINTIVKWKNNSVIAC